jgi:drug/metabolite transporter (DMT)-like permease
MKGDGTATGGTGAAARRERLIGILLMCSAVFCFSGLDATAKYLGRELPTEQIVWARYFASVVIVCALVNPITRPGVLRTPRPWLQALRSVLLLASTGLNFIAIRYLQLAEATAITFATPLLVTLLAALLLGERIGPRRIVAIGVGLVGVLVVTRPGLGGMHPAAIFSLLGCVAYASYSIATRMLSYSDKPETTLVYSGFAGVIVLTPLLPVFWTTPPSLTTWLLMGSMGFYAAFGHYLLILAHQRAPAAILSPFMYSQLLWMVALGLIVFGDVPDVYTIAGGLIVIASGLYLLSLERRRDG